MMIYEWYDNYLTKVMTNQNTFAGLASQQAGAEYKRIKMKKTYFLFTASCHRSILCFFQDILLFKGALSDTIHHSPLS
ncbi:MAG: hypothetical protein WDO16_18310, partial [Bacteroidota bacterium]